jgi:hypothetical protein
MEMLIFLVWVIMLLALPVAYLIGCYIGYTDTNNKTFVVASFSLSIVIHAALFYPYLYLMFYMIFAGAHTEPVGNALDLKGRLIYCGLVACYAVIGIGLFSLISGRPKSLWKQRNAPTDGFIVEKQSSLSILS